MAISTAFQRVFRKIGLRTQVVLEQSRTGRYVKSTLFLSTWRKKKVLVQLGRSRNPEIYPKGYQSATFKLPRMYLVNKEPQFEIFENFRGQLLSNEWSKISFPLPKALRKDVMTMYQYFRLVIEAAHLSPTYISPIAWFHWLETFRQRGRSVVKKKILSPVMFTRIERVYLTHLEGREPQWCLGNFSLTNLLYLKEGFAVRSLVRASQYPYGYDVAYLIWSLLFHLPVDLYDADFVDSEVQKVLRSFAAHEHDGNSTTERMKRYQLAIVERYVASLFDIAENVDHVKKIFSGRNEQKRKFQSLLISLLQRTLQRMKPG